MFAGMRKTAEWSSRHFAAQCSMRKTAEWSSRHFAAQCSKRTLLYFIASCVVIVVCAGLCCCEGKVIKKFSFETVLVEVQEYMCY